MSVIYLDSSALVKRYAQETGTSWVSNLTSYAVGNDLYTARLTGPEVIAALFRKARRGQIPIAGATQSATNFRQDWQQQYYVLEVGAGVSNLAMNLVEKYTLRGYDAIHVAAALEPRRARQASQLPGLTFISADLEQLHAAQAEGLSVDNPDNHP